MTLEMKMDEMFDKGVEIGEQRGIAETEQKLLNNLMVNMNITKEEAKER